MTNAEKFGNIFGLYATELWSMPEQDFLKWLNTDVPDTNVGDIISRQDAIDALGEEPEVWTGNDEYAQGLNNQWWHDVNALKALPPAQSEIIWCKDCKYNGECSIQYVAYADDKFFCGAGERKQDG